jgi:hypothetical protein
MTGFPFFWAQSRHGKLLIIGEVEVVRVLGDEDSVEAALFHQSPSALPSTSNSSLGKSFIGCLLSLAAQRDFAPEAMVFRPISEIYIAEISVVDRCQCRDGGLETKSMRVNAFVVPNALWGHVAKVVFRRLGTSPTRSSVLKQRLRWACSSFSPHTSLTLNFFPLGAAAGLKRIFFADFSSLIANFATRWAFCMTWVRMPSSIAVPLRRFSSSTMRSCS